MENILTINYKNGRGKLTVDLMQLLPCGTVDFKKLLSFVDLSDDPAGNADKLFTFISCQVQELKASRESENAESAVGKEKISKINSVLKKYIASAAMLTKSYGTPELSDDAAKIILKPAKVYSVLENAGKRFVKEFDGWTFEMSGLVFDIRKNDCGTGYIIMLHNTGACCARAAKKNLAAVEITPKVIDSLTSAENAKKLAEVKKQYKQLMVEAGYMEPEKEQEKQEEKNMQEERKTVEYSITESGYVLMFVVIGVKENGRPQKQRFTFAPDHPDYKAILEAAVAYGCKRPENILTSVNAPEPVRDIPEQKERKEQGNDPKAARGPVPEKTFIGQTIQGAGWKIFFDGSAERTRVIFVSDPSVAVKKVVENAGFYYSAKMNSWNKKLTFKAYRAALALAKELKKAC